MHAYTHALCSLLRFVSLLDISCISSVHSSLLRGKALKRLMHIMKPQAPCKGPPDRLFKDKVDNHFSRSIHLPLSNTQLLCILTYQGKSSSFFFLLPFLFGCSDKIAVSKQPNADA